MADAMDEAERGGLLNQLSKQGRYQAAVKPSLLVSESHNLPVCLYYCSTFQLNSYSGSSLLKTKMGRLPFTTLESTRYLRLPKLPMSICRG